MSNVLHSLPQRGITPFPYRLHAEPQFQKVDPKLQFQKDFVAYQQGCNEFAIASAECVYDNPDADQSLYRVHCYHLATLIAAGQLILGEVDEAQLEGVEAETAMIQKTVDGLIATMHDWHGAPGSHVDEPGDFAQAMSEADKGLVKPL